MTDQRPTLLELATRHASQIDHAALVWEGSFADYLDVLSDRPLSARNAWQRLLDMVESHGCHEPEEKGGWRRWKLFEDPFDGGRDAIFGLDESLARLVRTIRAGARGLGPEKRIPVPMWGR